MLGLMKVLGGMLVLGRITTADVSADKALPQVHPSVTHFEAFFAARAAGRDIADFFEVRTSWLSVPHWSLRLSRLITPGRSRVDIAGNSFRSEYSLLLLVCLQKSLRL
jgi:hypothetical protein